MKNIVVISLDRVGLVGEISKILSRVNCNIISHSANVSYDGTTAISRFSANVDLDSSYDDESLSRRIKKIKNVKQVKITDL